MALTQGPVSGPVKTYIADGPIAAGTAVVFGAQAGHVIAASVAGAVVAGIADQTVTAGQPVRVTRQGDTTAIAGGAITHGQYVKSDASGHLVAVTGTSGDGENIIGRAESDTVNVGDQLVVFVAPSVL